MQLTHPQISVQEKPRTLPGVLKELGFANVSPTPSANSVAMKFEATSRT